MWKTRIEKWKYEHMKNTNKQNGEWKNMNAQKLVCYPLFPLHLMKHSRSDVSCELLLVQRFLVLQGELCRHKRRRSSLLCVRQTLHRILCPRAQCWQRRCGCKHLSTNFQSFRQVCNRCGEICYGISLASQDDFCRFSWWGENWQLVPVNECSRRDLSFQNVREEKATRKSKRGSNIVFNKGVWHKGLGLHNSTHKCQFSLRVVPL